MSSDREESIQKAAFLGPKGENADELERLLLEVLRDHVFWRRNFHPSDPRLIDERDKRTEAFDEMSARLRDELSQILAELKRAAPLYSPRQVAHIVSDPSLPALVGYFAGRALLKILLEAAFEGLTDEGWLKLSRNWGVFFLLLAVLNEVLVATMDFEGWLWAKLWVFLPLTFLFTFANIPMLMKHGLSIDDADEVIKDEPPTGG